MRHTLTFIATLTVGALGAGYAVAQTAGPEVAASCAARTDVLGVSRIVEVDTTGGPRFGLSQYKELDFLKDGEVVLTFDDGPIRRYTRPVLDALDAECTKAIFFSVGKMALADPETLREIDQRGHTIASHTWSHAKLPTLSAAKAKDDIELGLSAVAVALGKPPAPFFRYPYLRDSKSTLAHLQARNMAIFSIDVDSDDFRTRNPAVVRGNVLQQLQHRRKGIILFHDIQPSTAGALASLLDELKTRGFKVVHMVAKSAAVTDPTYDQRAAKELARRKLAANANQLAKKSVVWPVGTPPPGKASGGADELPWLTKPGPAAKVQSGRPKSTRKAPGAQLPEENWRPQSLD